MVGILLGKGGSVVSTKREITAKANVGDDGCVEREQ